MHRDIRWPNVLHKKGDEWFLIDFDVACRAGSLATVPAVGLRAPELKDQSLDTYTTACDMFQVGVLMEDCLACWGGGMGEQVSEAGKLLVAGLLADNPEARLTAADALEHIFFSPQPAGKRKRCYDVKEF